MLELCNYIYMSQKLQNAAYTILNLTNSEERPQATRLRKIMATVPDVFVPYTIDEKDYFVAITVTQRDIIPPSPSQDKPYILWQLIKNGAGASSRFTHKRCSPRQQNYVNPADLNGYIHEKGEQLVTVEVTARYTPIVSLPWITKLYSNKFNATISSRPRKQKFETAPYTCP